MIELALITTITALITIWINLKLIRIEERIKDLDKGHIQIKMREGWSRNRENRILKVVMAIGRYLAE